VHITLENQCKYLDKHQAQKKIKKIDLQLALDKKKKQKKQKKQKKKQKKLSSLGR
jgi:hypothetical protein